MLTPATVTDNALADLAVATLSARRATSRSLCAATAQHPQRPRTSLCWHQARKKNFGGLTLD